MNEKGITAGLILALCAVAGAYPFVLSWGNLGEVRSTGNVVRIELPPAEKIQVDQLTALDTAVILGTASAGRRSLVEAEVAVVSDLATDPAGQAQDAVAVMPANPAGIAQADQPYGLLDVSYDLSQPSSQSGSALELRKNVRFNGADAGSATIRVGTGSALYIASDDLRTMLVAAQRADLAESLSEGADGSFVGFDQVRQNGLNLRYDPLSDRILISG